MSKGYQDADDKQVDESVELRSKFLSQAFSSPETFIQWVTGEVEVWESIVAPGESAPTDPVNQHGLTGAIEHAAEYRGYLDGLVKPQWENRIDFVAATRRAAQAISERLDNFTLIVSTSNVGQRVRALSVRDPSAAFLLITLYSGRNITRAISPQTQKLLWRGVGRILAGISDAETQSRVDDADRLIADLRGKAASAANADEELHSLLMRSHEEVEKAHQRTDAELRVKLTDLSTEADSTVSNIKEEWAELRELYKSEFALRAPVAYWKKRRLVHRIGAIVWGSVSIIFAAFIGLKMIPIGEAKFQEARETILQTQLQPAWISYLPEMFIVAVGAFICLWVLRFTVRQVSEHLGRGEEASQRVTMGETFLALSSPGEGQPALVGEADRAVIVQALFRPSALSGIDDAPPAHWIEDVFRRIKSGDSKRG